VRPTLSTTRILLCDFVGHAFPLELSRELAARGHSVSHVHLEGFVVGKGPLQPETDDPETLEIWSVDLGRAFPKYRPLRRAVHEIRFAARLARSMRRDPPDVLVLCTTPPVAQLLLVAVAEALRIPRVIWLQDLFGIAVESTPSVVPHRLSRLLASFVDWTERVALRRASHVVAISESFVPRLRDLGLENNRITVVPNWAALSGIGPGPKRNQWSKAHGLDQHKVLLYSGTLGYKHDWTALLDLGRALPDDGSVRLVVVSEGEFADKLARTARDEGLTAIEVLPFQPFDVLADVLATADVCIALLTDDAGRFSVPSKVQSYLAAGRPVVIAGPLSGDAAQAVTSCGAGVAVDSADRDAFVVAVLGLLDTPGDAGTRARTHAVAEFSVGPKADRFEQVLFAARQRHTRRRGRGTR
jgi:colanic acid biosynthesis glycosyl transferase WcaI